MAASDARTLVWELGKDRVTEDDVTSLPVHHCYVRATVGKERMPAFSMVVRKPEKGDPTVPARQSGYSDAEGRRKMGEYRKGLADLEAGGQKEELESGQDLERRKQTSKRRDASARDVHDRVAGEDGKERAEGCNAVANAGQEAEI